jgi:hypothetical protein
MRCAICALLNLPEGATIAVQTELVNDDGNPVAHVVQTQAVLG